MIYAYLTHRMLGWKWALVRFRAPGSAGTERQLCRILITVKPSGRRQVWARAGIIGPWGEWVPVDDLSAVTLVYPAPGDLAGPTSRKGAAP